MPEVNAGVRELALDLAEGKYGIDFVEHIPGRCNVHADVLPRFYQPGKSRTIPPELASAARSYPSLRIPAWWETAGEPDGTAGAVFIDSDGEAGRLSG